MTDPRGHDWIELGSGHSGLDEWVLVYDPVGPPPPDEHHITGPMIGLRIGSRLGAGRLRAPLPSFLAAPDLFVRSLDLPAHAYGAVDFGFDRVQIHCVAGPVVQAALVECEAYLAFNYYVGEVTSRVDRITATSPDGRTATWERDSAA